MSARRPSTESQIRQRLAVLRVERGLSRQQLAKVLGVRPQTVGYLERGEYVPTLAVALKIASVFDLPVEAIFGSNAQPEPLRATDTPQAVPDSEVETEQHRRDQRLHIKWAKWDVEMSAWPTSISAHASHRRRRWWVAIYLACVVTVCAAALLPEMWASLVRVTGLLVGLCLLASINNAIDNVAAGRDDALDEIAIRVRDGYRSRAYILLMISSVVACCILVFIESFAPPAGPGIVLAIAWPLYLLAMGLPALLAGWALPDHDQPHERP